MPFTTPAKSVYYSNRDLARSDLATGMLPEFREKEVNKYRLDFSLLRPQEGLADKEVEQILTQNCMPNRGYKSYSMLNEAHSTFARATSYLICAMKTEVSRLCNDVHRKYLVAQLMQYRALRQNLLGIERARAALLRNPMAKVFQDISQQIEGGPRRNSNPKIGKWLDARLGRNLRILVQSGYISASDFGFMGISLPAEYAPYLTDGVIGQSMCR